jgi:hypothetical protein
VCCRFCRWIITKNDTIYISTGMKSGNFERQINQVLLKLGVTFPVFVFFLCGEGATWCLFRSTQLWRGFTTAETPQLKNVQEGTGMGFVRWLRNKFGLKTARHLRNDTEEGLDDRQQFIYVNPKGNSKNCAVCSNRQKKESKRETVQFYNRRAPESLDYILDLLLETPQRKESLRESYSSQ